MITGCGSGGSSPNAVDLDPGKGAQKGDALNTSNIDPGEGYLRLLNADHFAFVTMDLPAIMNDEQTKDVPWEKFFESPKEYGENLFEVGEVKNVVWMMDSTFMDGPQGNPREQFERKTLPGFATAIEHNTKFDVERISKILDDAPTMSRIEPPANVGHDFEIRAWGNETDKVGVLLAGDKQLVMGSIESVNKMLKTTRRNNALLEASVDMAADKQVQGVMVFGPLRPSFRQQASQARTALQAIPIKEIGELMVKMLEAPEVTESARFEIHLSADELCKIVVLAEDEQNANELSGLATEVVGLAQELSLMASGFQMAGGGQPEAMIPSTTGRLFRKILRELTSGGMSVDTDGRKINVVVQQSKSTREFIRASVGDTTKQIALQQRIEAMKKIGKAIKDYYVENEAYPLPENTIQSGKFSWRVAILPHLGHKELYEKFNFNESWDSEHNLKVAKEIPEVYSLFGADEKTSLHFPGGDGAFGGDKKLTNEAIMDDIGETVLVVEGADETSEIWTKPGALQITRESIPKLGRKGENGILGLTFEGDVKKIKRSIADTLVDLFTIAGDEKIENSYFFDFFPGPPPEFQNRK